MPRSTGPTYLARPNNLHKTALKDRLKKSFQKNFEHIARALRVADAHKKGVVHTCVFRNILEAYCFPLTDWQWIEINRDFICPTANFDYNIFAKYYLTPVPEIPEQCPNKQPKEEDLEKKPCSSEVPPKPKINSKLYPIIKPDCRLPRQFDICLKNRVLGQPLKDASYMVLRNFIKWKWQDIIGYCKSMDSLKKGILSGSAFKSILYKAGVPITDAQMANYLARSYGVCEGSEVDYWNFLRQFVLIKSSDINTAYISFYKMQSMRKSVDSHSFANSVKLILKIRRQVLQNWSSLLFCFRKCDPCIDGIIECCIFIDILRGHGIQLEEQEMFDLMLYFDPNLSGTVSYLDFLRCYCNNIYDG